MKQLNKVSIVLIILLGLFILYLLECKRAPECLKDGEMIIAESVWDEIKALADKPPEIQIDTFIIKGETVYIDHPVPIPVPDPADTTILVYSDTLNNDSINAWIDFRLRGELISLRWGYTPLTTEIIQETTIYVPQIVNNEVPVYKREIFLSGAVGGNVHSFTYGADVDYVNKKRNIYGFQYRRIQDDNFYMIKVGAKIQFRQ